MLEKRLSLCKYYNATDEINTNIFCWGVEESLCQGKQRDSSVLSCCQSPSNDVLFLLALAAYQNTQQLPKHAWNASLSSQTLRPTRLASTRGEVEHNHSGLFSQESMRSARNPHEHRVLGAAVTKPWAWVCLTVRSPVIFNGLLIYSVNL